MTQDRAIAHLEAIRHDIRDEIKRRIEQRDRYSIQLTIALGTIVAVGFVSTGFDKVLIAAPLVSMYFSVLILYSYRIHRILTNYLREGIEPELATRCGSPGHLEWETYYKDHAVPGIRKRFFMVALWVAWLLPLVYLWFVEEALGATDLTSFRITLLVAAGIYGLANSWMTLYFLKD